MYNKLFTKILDSSIWLEDDATLRIWITFLAAMDQDGFAAFASVANLAHRARKDIETTEKAVAKLESPDPYSSDPEFDGRRVEKIPGGWIVLNAEKYRDIIKREHQLAMNRARVAAYRERQKLGNADTITSPLHSPDGNDTVTDQPLLSGKCNDNQTQIQNQTQNQYAVPRQIDQLVVSHKGEESEKGDPASEDVAPLLGDEESQSLKVSPKNPKKTKDPHPTVLRLNTLFGRRPETQWSDKEKKAIKAIGHIPEEDLLLIEARYDRSKDIPYRRQTLLTLLNNWHGELDRARNPDTTTLNRPTARNVSLNTSPASQQTARELIEEHERRKAKS